MTRTVTEQVIIGDKYLNIQVTTSDGLAFNHEVVFTGLNENTVKHFEDQLTQVRKAAYDRRVWLNKRKSLTLDEINQLLSVNNDLHISSSTEL